MDIDDYNDDDREELQQMPIFDSDKSDSESEDMLDLSDDFGMDDPEMYIEKQQCSASENLTMNRFFSDLIFGKFTDKQRSVASKIFDMLIEERFTLNIAFVHLSQLAVKLMDVHYDLTDSDVDPLLEKIKIFAKSRALQNAYISQAGNRIAPQKISIGDFNYYYVPLHDQLKQLLQNPSVVTSILNEKEMLQMSTFTVYNSELTSSRRSHLLGKARIELGADDFCVAKPIGPRATQQKYLAVYLTLTNIPIKHRSKRENIRIVLIANRHQMKASNISINILLKRLRDDLYLAMTRGIDVQVNINEQSTTVNIPVTFSGFLGDNKGTYEVLGLNESFGRYFVCRACMSNRTAIERDVNFRLYGTSEDVREYKRKVTSLNKNKNGWGIKGPYIFGDLPGVDIFNSAPFDVLHDLPQGVIPRLFPLMLWYSGSKFSFKVLLSKIEKFEMYHGSVSFNSVNQLKGTAVQVRPFVVFIDF